MAIQHIDNPEDTEDNCNERANKKSNIFDSLPALAPPKASNLGSELNRYLSTDAEHIINAIGWWHEHYHTYPSLSHMALDYLTVPGMYLSFLYDQHSWHCTNEYKIAMSVDVKQLFSHG